MIGLIPFMGAAYAAIIVTIMYFGIKIYVSKRKQTILQDVGEESAWNAVPKFLTKNVQIVMN